MFRRRRRTWSFHVVVLQRTAKKCTKNYNARAQPLFCSLNLLFGAVLVAVVVVFAEAPFCAEISVHGFAIGDLAVNLANKDCEVPFDILLTCSDKRQGSRGPK